MVVMLVKYKLILKDVFTEIMDTKKKKKKDNMPGRSTCEHVLGNKT